MRDYIENGIVADYQDHHYPSEMSVDAMIQTYLMDDSADATDTFMKRFDKEWIRYNRDVVAKVKAYEEVMIMNKKHGAWSKNEKIFLACWHRFWFFSSALIHYR